MSHTTKTAKREPELLRVDGTARPRMAHQLHGAHAFQQLVEYERLRSDRSGLSFAMIRIDLRESSPDEPQHLREIAAYLVDRLRDIDEVGWLSPRRLGVLLPYTPGEKAWHVVDDIVKHCGNHPLPPMCEVSSYADGAWIDSPEPTLPRHAKHDRLTTPMIDFFAQPMPLWKRSMDLAAAGSGAILSAPLFAVIALLVKLSGPGPVFFSQWRTGHGGRRFRMLKFRTMVVGAEAKRDELLHMNEQDGPAFKIKNDPRITRIGGLLRKTSLDELPQLWNVLKGEMSLVGPRPLPCAEAEACEQWQQRRHDVTPGLTCVWQVSGRSGIAFDDWMRMDIQYVKECSPWTDLKLLLKTIPAVIFRRGAH